MLQSNTSVEDPATSIIFKNCKEQGFVLKTPEHEAVDCTIQEGDAVSKINLQAEMAGRYAKVNCVNIEKKTQAECAEVQARKVAEFTDKEQKEFREEHRLCD